MTITGCTVHYVQKEVDSGSIIIQAAVPLNHKDEKTKIKESIHNMEHKILPIAVGIVAKEIRSKAMDKM